MKDERKRVKAGPRVDTVRLQNLSYGFRQAATLMAAIELDLFTKVSAGASSLSQIAEALDITPLNAERVVTACTALGLLEKEGDSYSNAPDVERFLVQGKRSYIGPWIMLGKQGVEQWMDLASFLRSKEPPRMLGSYEGFTVERARQLHEATYSIGMGAGYRFARQCDLSGRSLMLDLGGGSGCYCIAAVQQYPDLQAIVFDLPSVCVVAREFIEQWGLSDRIQTQAGDFTKDEFPRGADVILMASNLPQYGPHIIELVVNKAYEALVPSGEMHIIGEALNYQKTGPMGPALWGLNEALYGSTGRAHSEEETRGYLKKAGFEQVTAMDFVPGSLTRVCGRKPS